MRWPLARPWRLSPPRDPQNPKIVLAGWVEVGLARLRWSFTAVAAPPRLVPVLAGHTEHDAGGLVLQMPSGAQVLGLDVQTAAALLRALG